MHADSHNNLKDAHLKDGMQKRLIFCGKILLLRPNLHHLATQLLPEVIVVADVENGASVALQRRLELFNAGQVEVVGRLIENEQLWLIG